MDQRMLNDAMSIVSPGGLLMCIDPGPKLSGYCLMSTTLYRPIAFGKEDNGVIEGFLIHEGKLLQEDGAKLISSVVIEDIASYGMPVSADVFDTCKQIGRFAHIAEQCGLPVEYVFRREEKLAICHSPNANDSTIRTALIDRFARGVRNYGKGTKNEPGFFYGFSKDAWSAFAVGVTYIDRKKENENGNRK